MTQLLLFPGGSSPHLELNITPYLQGLLEEKRPDIIVEVDVIQATGHIVSSTDPKTVVEPYIEMIFDDR